MGLRWGYGGGMEGQSILNRRQVSVGENLCQAGGPKGAFACSIPPKTAKKHNTEGACHRSIPHEPHPTGEPPSDIGAME